VCHDGIPGHPSAAPREHPHKVERVLIYGQVLRAGSLSPRAVDVRILAATHVDLQQRAQHGEFRDSLYLRLAAMQIHLPPLRERIDDIPALCEIYSRQIAAELRVAEKKLDPAALKNLLRYAFPGNLRELRNLIERAYLLSDRNKLVDDDFPLPSGPTGVSASAAKSEVPSLATMPSERFNLTDIMEQIEKTLITQVLSATGGAQAEAARRMGLSRSVLAYKLNKYGIRKSA